MVEMGELLTLAHLHHISFDGHPVVRRGALGLLVTKSWGSQAF